MPVTTEMHQHPAPTSTSAAHAPASRVHLHVTMLLALVIALLAWMAAPQVARADDADGGLTVAPARVDLDIPVGGSESQVLTIINTFDVGMTFTLDTEDLIGSRADPQSTPILVGGALDSPITAAGWIHPASNSIHLASGESGTVRVTVNVPSGISAGGHYGAVTVSTPSFQLGGDLHGKSRVAVPFMINAGNVPPPELTITDVTSHTNGTTTVKYTNTGVKAATPDGTITWIDPVTGHTVGTTKASSCTAAFPKASGQCSIPGLDSSHQTQTTADDAHPGRVDSGTRRGSISLVGYGSHARASTPTQWKGSWSSMILPLVGLALFILYFARLRRHDDEDEFDDDMLASHDV